MSLNLGLNTSALKEYKVSGAILGCLGSDKDKVNYKIVEKLPNDPWVAIIESKGLITKEELELWHKYHVVDVDHKGVPYYFIVTHFNSHAHPGERNKSTFVWYSDDKEMMPINDQNQKDKAVKAGIKKGLDPKQLDF